MVFTTHHSSTKSWTSMNASFIFKNTLTHTLHIIANQLTGFYMRATLALNGLSRTLGHVISWYFLSIVCIFLAYQNSEGKYILRNSKGIYRAPWKSLTISTKMFHLRWLTKLWTYSGSHSDSANLVFVFLTFFF